MAARYNSDIVKHYRVRISAILIISFHYYMLHASGKYASEVVI